MSKAKTRVIIGILFLVFWMIGIVTAGDYGPSWDEPDEMDILRMNLWEYARSFHLDEDPFEAFVSDNHPLTISKLTPISESIEQDHGIALFYPLAPVVLSQKITEETRSIYWHAVCWSIFTLGALALFGVLKGLGLGNRFALIGPVLLILSPRFFAQGHFNNKDIVLFSLTLCMVWSSLRFARKPVFSAGLLCALIGAFLFNVKIIGLAIWGLCMLYVLLSLAVQKKLHKGTLIVGGISFCAFFCFYLLLTPAAWSNPAVFLKYSFTNALSFSRWKNYLLFRGAIYDYSITRQPRYYLPYMIFMTTPLWISLCALVGCVTLPSRIKHSPVSVRCSLWTIVALFTIPFVFAILSGTRIYNGWRHFYFLYGPLLILAVFGIQNLLSHSVKPFLRKTAAVLLALCVLLESCGLIMQHPFQFAYYNPAEKADRTNELDYWNVSTKSAILKLLEQKEGSVVIAGCDPWAQNALIKAFPTLPSNLQSRIRIVDNSDQADMVLINPTYAAFSGYTADKNAETLVKLSSYGQTIMQIDAVSKEVMQ